MCNRRAEQPGENSAARRNRVGGDGSGHLAAIGIARSGETSCEIRARIARRRYNTITLLCAKHNLMLSFPDPGCRLPRPASRQPDGAHLRAQAIDVVLDVE